MKRFKSTYTDTEASPILAMEDIQRAIDNIRNASIRDAEYRFIRLPYCVREFENPVSLITPPTA